MSVEFSKISSDGKIERFFPNKSIKEIIFVILILSLSSRTSALLIESVASDHECPIFDTRMLGSKFT